MSAEMYLALFLIKVYHKMLSMIGGGTTVLFVSHSTEQIRSLCSKVIWLEKGKIVALGGVEICDEYIRFIENKKRDSYDV